MRPLGITLIAAGVLLALPQIVVPIPYQPFVALGLALAVAGGLLLCDHVPRDAADERTDR